MSKYWNQPNHAGIAKRKIPEGKVVAPKDSRKATHNLRGVNKDDSDSDRSDSNNDS